MASQDAIDDLKNKIRLWDWPTDDTHPVRIDTRYRGKTASTVANVAAFVAARRVINNNQRENLSSSSGQPSVAGAEIQRIPEPVRISFHASSR